MAEILAKFNDSTIRQNNKSTIDAPNNFIPKSQKSISKAELAILVIILLTGLLLRAGYLREIVDAFDFSAPVVDAGFHDYWARALLSGDWTPTYPYEDPQIRTSPYFRPPGYPYFLALLYWLTNSSYLSVRICQMALGLVNCILAWLVGRYLFGRVVGLVYAALMSIYWIFIYFEGELMEPALLIFLLLLGIVFLILWLKRFAFYYILLAGFSHGLATLVRPNCLLFLPIMILWTGLVARKKLRWQAALISALVAFLGAILAIAPVTIRNYVVGDDIVLISSNAGINLFIGNNDAAEGKFVMLNVPGKGIFDTSYDYHFIVKLVEEELGRPLKHSEVSRYWAAVAIKYIKEYPTKTFKLALKKTALFWGPIEIPHNKDVQKMRNASSTLRTIPLNFPFVLSLCVIGISRFVLDVKAQKISRNHRLELSRESRQISLFILLFVLTYFLSYLPFFNAALYRVPLIPFLMLFAAYGLYRIIVFTIANNYPKAAIWGLLCAGAYLVVSMEMFPSLGQSGVHSQNGIRYVMSGQLNEATREFNEALKLKPDNLRANYGMGYALLEQGKLDEATIYFEKVLKQKPDYVEAHDNLGTIFLQLGKLDKALSHHAEALRLNPKGRGGRNLALSLNPNYVEVYFHIAAILAKKDKTDQAFEYLRHAVRMKSDSSRAHLMLGVASLKYGNINEAIKHLIITSHLDPNSPESYYNLGKAFAKKQESKKAIACFEKAIYLKADYNDAHYDLANILLEEGNITQAINHYQQVLQTDPNNQLARNKLAQAKTLLSKNK